MPGSLTGLDPEQIANAKTIAAVGKKLGASSKEIAIAIMTAMDESSLHNLHGGDRDSQGLFQQRPSQGWGTPEQVTNPVYAATQFYTRLLQVPNVDKIAPWQAAQNVQISAFSDGSNYRAYWDAPSHGFNVSAQQITESVLNTTLPNVSDGNASPGTSPPSNSDTATPALFGIPGTPKGWQNFNPGAWFDSAAKDAKSIPDTIKLVAAPLALLADFFHKLVWIFNPSNFIKFLMYMLGLLLVASGIFFIIHGAGKERV